MHRTIALLVIHGIGKQERGEWLTTFVRSFKHLGVYNDQSQAPTFTAQNRLIRLYEVYWADILKGEAVKGSFNDDLVLSTSWFPYLNLKFGRYLAGEYSRFLVWFRILQLLLLGVAFYFLHKGGIGLLHLYYSLVNISKDFIKTLRVLAHSGSRGRDSGRPDAEELIDYTLDEYVGDVFTYVNSSVCAVNEQPLGSSADKILARFNNQMSRAIHDGCDEIQIFAHSLGTLVMYHGLTAFRLLVSGLNALDEAGTKGRHLPVLSRIYTIGSPLEKILFLWPKLIRRDLPGPVIVFDGADILLRVATRNSFASGFQWHNFYDVLDPVAGQLKRFPQWTNVENHRSCGRGGIYRAHVNYQRNPHVVSIVTEGLLGRAYIPQWRESFFERVKILGLSVIETVLGLLPLLAGVFYAILIVFVLGFVSAWVWGDVFRLLGLADSSSNVPQWTGYGLLLLMSILVIVLGYQKSTRSYEKFAN